MYIKNSNIDREKWDQCIVSSCNPRIYAISWYLDIVCKNWDGLVFGDYEVVFPVVFKKRFFLKKSYHPFFCQQLGPFLKDKNLTLDQCMVLFSSIEKYFKYYTFSATSEFSSLFQKLAKDKMSFSKNGYRFLSPSKYSCRDISFVFQNNLEIYLGKNYNKIKDSYSENTIRNLKKSHNFNLKLKHDISINLFLELYKTNKSIKKSIQGFFSFSNNYELISRLIHICLQKDKGRLIGICNQQNNIVSAAFFLSCFNRDIMLFNVTHPDWKKYHGMTFLIDDYIKSNCNQNKVLDFEGSNLVGVKNFYSGFGSINKPYFLFKNKSF